MVTEYGEVPKSASMGYFIIFLVVAIVLGTALILAYTLYPTTQTNSTTTIAALHNVKTFSSNLKSTVVHPPPNSIKPGLLVPVAPNTTRRPPPARPLSIQQLQIVQATQYHINLENNPNSSTVITPKTFASSLPNGFNPKTLRTVFAFPTSDSLKPGVLVKSTKFIHPPSARKPFKSNSTISTAPFVKAPNQYSFQSSSDYYDEQLALTFTQDVTSIVYNVTAVPQTENFGGPAYLLNGLSNEGYWYQMALEYNWPGTQGWTFAIEPWTPSGLQYQSVSDFSGPINTGDKVQLAMYFSNGNITATAYDLNTGAYASYTFTNQTIEGSYINGQTGSASFGTNGATYFVGITSGNSNPSGYFTGLMTEEYTQGEFLGPQQSVTYSIVSNTGLSSAYLGMDEFDVNNSAIVFGTANPVSFSPPTQFYSLTYANLTEEANSYQFITGGNTSGITTTSTTTIPNTAQYYLCAYANPNNIGGGFYLNGQFYSDGQRAPIQVNQIYSLFSYYPSGYYFGGWTAARGVYVTNPYLANTTVIFSASGWDGVCVGNLAINYQLSTTSSTSITSSTSTMSTITGTSTSSTSTGTTTSTSTSTSTIVNSMNYTIWLNQYDEQMMSVLPDNYSTLVYNVTATAQLNYWGGPAYLLNGLSNTGYWYQVGLEYDWPGTQGWTLAIEPWTSNGTTYDGTLNFSGPINFGDTVQLAMYFSNGNITVAGYDLNTGAYASYTFGNQLLNGTSYGPNGATFFVGVPPGSWNGAGEFTGLMTEQWFEYPYNGKMQPVTYTLVSNDPLKYEWLLMDEWQPNLNSLGVGWSVCGTAASSSTCAIINFTNSTQFQTLSYDNATMRVNGYQLITGSSPLAMGVLNPAAQTINQGQTALINVGNIYNGTTPYHYQWVEQAPGSNYFVPIQGATNSQIAFSTNLNTVPGTYVFKLEIIDNYSSSQNAGYVLSPPATVVVNSQSTITATSTSSTISTITGTSTSTTSSTSTIYPTNGPIQILSIEPSSLTVGRRLNFTIAFRNNGTIPIYYDTGCVSPVYFNVSPQNAVNSSSPPGVSCLAITKIRVDPYTDATLSNIGGSVVPSVYFSIAKPEQVTVNFTLIWANAYNQSNLTHFSASYTFINITSTTTSTISTTTISQSQSYPSGPTFGCFGSWYPCSYGGSYGVGPWNQQFNSSATLVPDGVYGRLSTADVWTQQDEGANWTWDFGSPKSGTFNARWYVTVRPVLDQTNTYYYPENAQIQWQASNDQITWTTFDIVSVVNSYSSTPQNFATPPAVISISGTYRYIRFTQYSDVVDTAYINSYVDGIWLSPTTNTPTTSSIPTTTSTPTISTTSIYTTTIPQSQTYPININISASDPSDPNLRYWELWIDRSPGSYLGSGNYQNSPYTETTAYQGSTWGGPLSLSAGSHNIYFEVTQTGGSSYGTYSGYIDVTGTYGISSCSFANVNAYNPAIFNIVIANGGYVQSVSCGNGGSVTTTTTISNIDTTISYTTIQYSNTSFGAVCTYANPNNIGAGFYLNDQFYTDGKVAPVQTGIYYSLFYVPQSYSYSFNYWSTSGGVYIENPYSNFTYVIFYNTTGNPVCLGNLGVNLH